MQKLVEGLRDRLAQGQNAMLCTIIESRGSAPRGAGACMAILADGSFLGTIGGGVMEYRAQQRGQELLAAGRSQVDAFSLNAKDSANIGMICGGNVRVFYQYCTPANLAFFQAMAQALGEDQDIWMALEPQGERGWTAALYGRSGERLAGDGMEDRRIRPLLQPRSVLQEEEGQPFLLVMPVTSSGFVYIFGGGHVSRELVPVLAHVGFRPVIFEDRPDFADPKDFPGAVQTLVGDLANFGASIQVRRQDYIAIMTRGHMADYGVLEQALRTPARYVGLIGSRAKMAATSKRLMESGFTAKDIARIHNPIGLPILAETPAEIAISIAAEMILHRAQGIQAE